MAAGLTTFQALINGAARIMVGGQDGSGSIAPGHTLLDANAAPFGITGNEVVVKDSALGAPADTAYAGSGGTGVIAALKGIYIRLAGALTVVQGGSIGADRSANAPAGPGAATSFVFNGVTVNLLATIAANPNRRGLEINNTTGNLVVVVLDDGANTAGAVSLFPLAAGAGAFQQGADFSPPNELGRCRIFGATGTYCYARET